MLENIREIVGIAFASRNYAHYVHLNTNRHFVHIVMQEFYEGIIDAVDAFVETWQGLNLEPIGAFPTYKYNESLDAAEQMQAYLQLLEDQWGGVESNSVLQSKMDDVLSVYITAIYKLTFFSQKEI